MEIEARPCICGKLWGIEFRTPVQFVVCLCGQTLTIFGGDSWYIQHGENPEHRSPDYDGGSLIAACDWIDAVCLEARGATGEDAAMAQSRAALGGAEDA